LGIHVALPALGSTPEKDVDDFIITQALISVKCSWTTSNLLGGDAVDVHDVLLCTHVYLLVMTSNSESYAN